LLLGAALGLDVQGSGSTTFRRRIRERGLEPDECFHIRNFKKVVGPRNLDLRRDPPPDLAIEVEISRSALDRMGIYAALGVPEVWRCDGETLTVWRLRDDGTYEPCDRSLSFPSLPLTEFLQFLHQTEDLSEAGLIAPFQKWVREHALPREKGGKKKRKR
jgi:Uma2 family endonuclease